MTITFCIVTKTIPWCLNLWLGGYFLNLNADSKLTENSFRLSLHLGGSFSCTTSSIVNLSMFSCAFVRPPLPERKALQNYVKFLNWQNFLSKFLKKFIILTFRLSFAALFAAFSEALPKSECKVTTFPWTDKIFLQVFLHFLIISLLIRGLWENQESGRTGKTGNDEKTGNDGNDLKY